MDSVNIGIIGDFKPEHASYKATDDALNHAADHLSIELNTTWIATPSLLTADSQRRLERFSGLFGAPGDYDSQEGALRGIQLAREWNRPFIGT